MDASVSEVTDYGLNDRDSEILSFPLRKGRVKGLECYTQGSGFVLQEQEI